MKGGRRKENEEEEEDGRKNRKEENGRKNTNNKENKEKREKSPPPPQKSRTQEQLKRWTKPPQNAHPKRMLTYACLRPLVCARVCLESCLLTAATSL